MRAALPTARSRTGLREPPESTGLYRSPTRASRIWPLVECGAPRRSWVMPDGSLLGGGPARERRDERGPPHREVPLLPHRPPRTRQVDEGPLTAPQPPDDITNALTEGFNSKIQALKAEARGFRSFENYRTRILFFCGKLDLMPALESPSIHTIP